MALYDTSSRPNKIEPSQSFIAITPHDTLELNKAIRAVYVGAAGDLVVNGADGVTVTFAAVPAGSVLPIKPTVILSTGTGASSIVGLL
tara:strand:- start:1865 stop:2128 length:264 start_codon:yes stop_codon:yes gene_type:complete